MITRITLKRLPLENLKRKPFRTAALVIVVMMLTLAFFGGSLLSMNLRNGLRSMQERMGADLMVVPQDTGAKAEALLTNGGSNTFYFTNDIENLVSKADGISRVTAQTYISSLVLRREGADHRLQPRDRLRHHPLDHIAVRRDAERRRSRSRLEHQRIRQQRDQAVRA
jgi:hypothetical protein